jgi:hypothetical protein
VYYGIVQVAIAVYVINFMNLSLFLYITVAGHCEGDAVKVLSLWEERPWGEARVLTATLSMTPTNVQSMFIHDDDGDDDDD